MKITMYEQSGFILETNTGYTLAVDIGAYTPLEKLENTKVDAMLVSHIHGDHFSIEHIQKLDPKKLYLNQECIDLLKDVSISSEIAKVKTGDILNIGDIRVQVFVVDHGPNIKMVPQENFGFLIEADGKKVYFAGDMFNPSGIDVSTLEVDCALIPIGTFYTFGPQEAISFIAKFKKIGTVIPMHYEKNMEMREEFVALAHAQGIATE